MCRSIGRTFTDVCRSIAGIEDVLFLVQYISMLVYRLYIVFKKLTYSCTWQANRTRYIENRDYLKSPKCGQRILLYREIIF